MLLTPLRVWAVTDTRVVMALSKVDRTTELVASLQNAVAAPPGQKPDVIGVGPRLG